MPEGFGYKIIYSESEAAMTGLGWIWRHTADMKFRVVLEHDPEADSYSAVCPELPGCASAGDTEEQARRSIKEAIQLYLSPAEIELSPTAKLIEVTVG